MGSADTQSPLLVGTRISTPIFLKNILLRIDCLFFSYIVDKGSDKEE